MAAPASAEELSDVAGRLLELELKLELDWLDEVVSAAIGAIGTSEVVVIATELVEYVVAATVVEFADRVAVRTVERVVPFVERTEATTTVSHYFCDMNSRDSLLFNLVISSVHAFVDDVGDSVAAVCELFWDSDVIELVWADEVSETEVGEGVTETEEVDPVDVVELSAGSEEDPFIEVFTARSSRIRPISSLLVPRLSSE